MTNEHNEKNEQQSNESAVPVVQAEGIGVAFEERNNDDYKSKLINLFKNKKNKKKKEKKWPLTDIDFTGYEGEILGIIGSNGAGKTTLSKIITGILKEDKGFIDVDGKVTALFSFGMGFNKELTGRENVFLNGMMLGINKDVIERYIDDIHEFSDLGDFIDQPMKYYSSGMKARLGFSVAAHLEPEILILDEALNTGDAKFSRKASLKMKELVKKAKMVIIVTHSLPYAQRNCDRLMWINGGVIEAIGDPKEVVQKYRATVPVMPRRKPKPSLQVEKTDTTVVDKDIIKAENVGVSFQLNSGKFWALKDVSFNIKEGEVVGIIGHNGAGKSTLCKVLTKILAPDTGNLELNGETSSLLGYGTGFNAQLTGTDNIYLNAMLLGISKKRVEENYDEIVEFSGLKQAIHKPVKEYSSGMKARLGFSIAAILKPDIFIIDEALSTGDMAFQQKASERIQEMMERAKAVIIVTHSMQFVEKVCTRGIWMEQGQVKFDGPAEEAVEKYRESLGVQKQGKQRNLRNINNGQNGKNNNGPNRANNGQKVNAQNRLNNKQNPNVQSQRNQAKPQTNNQTDDGNKA
ncbi:ABC transporter ATP-binding protein [Pontibacillus litoralis]|uniref:Teichoic acid ABC transporter ATP-binding protein n=1 Tax=Pontibacillus litoralis JSM 072002 TaxID=1385512 RepID=A0A0A5G7X4_9BACI|nr:ATP-binding cassette domain-containing protein [Pontibacillus litoralis]KGX87205.1 teichoic acid ABC transporter ATP-binding protein [Pontibacillus litoralis JSM 072002]